MGPVPVGMYAAHAPTPPFLSSSCLSGHMESACTDESESEGESERARASESGQKPLRRVGEELRGARAACAGQRHAGALRRRFPWPIEAAAATACTPCRTTGHAPATHRPRTGHGTGHATRLTQAAQRSATATATMEALLGKTLLTPDLRPVATADALRSKDYVCLYFSAHW